MASLKEIKGRITSVKSTQKITEAMKMVASAKLHKVQYQIERFLPYNNRLNDLLNRVLQSAPEELNSPFFETHEVKRVAILVFSSNNGLCGAFNTNIIKLLNATLEKYRQQHCETAVYPIGKKAEETVKKHTAPIDMQGSYTSLIDKPSFEGAKEIADQLMNDFRAGRIRQVELIYNHFKSTAVQIPVEETFLPITPAANKHIPAGYLIEPDKETLLNSLLPQALRSKLYAVLLDSVASEQAARMVAMQIATDNVDEILEDLTLRYNKQRQQSISNEILDIIGGSLNNTPSD